MVGTAEYTEFNATEKDKSFRLNFAVFFVGLENEPEPCFAEFIRLLRQFWPLVANATRHFIREER